MKIFEKILQTIVWVCLGLFGLYLTFIFIYGYQTMDDDIMFISGLSLAVFVSILILIRTIIFDIYVIWHEDKKKKSKNEPSK